MSQGNVYNNTRIIPLVSSGNVTQSAINNSKVYYRFPAVQAVQRCKLALSHLSVYYSWYNITAAYGNNVFSYNWPTSTGYLPYSVTIPDGNYGLSDLSSYLQYAMQQNNTYLIDASGNNQYFISFADNATYYRVTLTATVVPTSLPAGWSKPSAATWSLPTTATNAADSGASPRRW